jgi:hypothetical protein
MNHLGKGCNRRQQSVKEEIPLIFQILDVTYRPIAEKKEIVGRPKHEGQSSKWATSKITINDQLTIILFQYI